MNTKYVYKNISGVEQTLIGVGTVGVDAVVSFDEPLENPNFELQSIDRPKAKDMVGIVPVTKSKKGK